MKAVAIPLATLWNAPREGAPSDVVTQLLLGDPVVVDSAREDGWVRVIAPDQPAPLLDSRGYPGWLRSSDLAPLVSDRAPVASDPAPLISDRAPVASDPAPLISDRAPVASDPAPFASDGAPVASDPAPFASGAVSIVDALRTDLCDAPGGSPRLRGVPLGARLAAAGPAERGWLPVRAPGHDAPLWADATHVRPVGARRDDPAAALAVARRLLGVRYVWGGLSPAGIDCSGLVHLAWRVLGARLPRDAHEQAAATEPVPPGQERAGDLYFFARPAVRIHHVGIVVAPGRMLHACGRAARVVEEPPDADRTATLTGAFRVRANP